MISSRRDYLQRIVDEICRMVALLILKRQYGGYYESLDLVIQAYERLFDLPRERIFAMNADQQVRMLTLDEPPDIARDKLLMYAALSDQAGRTYTTVGKEAMATAAYANALRFSLRAQTFKTDAPVPKYAPKMDELLALVGPDRLDPDIAAMLAEKELRDAGGAGL